MGMMLGSKNTNKYKNNLNSIIATFIKACFTIFLWVTGEEINCGEQRQLPSQSGVEILQVEMGV